MNHVNHAMKQEMKIIIIVLNANLNIISKLFIIIIKIASVIVNFIIIMIKPKINIIALKVLIALKNITN